MSQDYLEQHMNTGTTAKTKTLQFDCSTPDIRLDKYVSQALSMFSRSYIQRLIEQGHILVNGAKTKASRKLNINDSITIELPAAPQHLIAEPISLSIIYQDEDILVIDKPPGLVVHPGPGHPSHTVVNAILDYCPELVRSTDLIRPGIVHRLDKDTSGLMVIAKNDSVRKFLSDQFRSRTVKRGYLVLVRGWLSPKEGMIEAPIGRDPHNRQRMAVVAMGKEASTKYQVREYLGDYTLIEAFPITGRTHQIRLHFAAIGFPVVGDLVYGAKFRHDLSAFWVKRHFVHAYLLSFQLPYGKGYREFKSPLPMDLRQALQFLYQETRKACL